MQLKQTILCTQDSSGKNVPAEDYFANKISISPKLQIGSSTFKPYNKVTELLQTFYIAILLCIFVKFVYAKFACKEAFRVPAIQSGDIARCQ